MNYYIATVAPQYGSYIVLYLVRGESLERATEMMQNVFFSLRESVRSVNLVGRADPADTREPVLVLTLIFTDRGEP